MEEISKLRVESGLQLTSISLAGGGPGLFGIPPRVVGLLSGIGAGLLWGFVFLAPHVLQKEYTENFEIAFGRCAVFGLWSLLSVGLQRQWGALRFSSGIWLMSLFLAFTGFFGYYCLVVYSMRLAGGAIVALIVGIIPVSVPLAGVLIAREMRFRQVALPISLILPGLLLVERDDLAGADWSIHLKGIALAFLAMALWTIYSLVNARFLRSHPTAHSEIWSASLGISSLAMVVAALGVKTWLTHDVTYMKSYLHSDFLWWSAVLGIGSSWAATILWNAAIRRLPVAVAGQLIVFETISGLFYLYVADRKMPPFTCFLGILMLLTGVSVGLRSMNDKPKE